MRVVILTSHRKGIASLVLPELCKASGVDVSGIILARRGPRKSWKLFRRKAVKVWRIGPGGALVGYSMRSWYDVEGAVDLYEVAKECGVSVQETERVNCEQTEHLMSSANADLGLSLGNAYIQSRVYRIPRMGMVNIHEELLPEVQGGHSVIWAILEGREYTGFTIHRIDKGIDTGDILVRRRYPIEYRPSLSETVRRCLRKVRSDIPGAFKELCENYDKIASDSTSQDVGRAYTTPTLWEYLRMARNNRRAYNANVPQS